MCLCFTNEIFYNFGTLYYTAVQRGPRILGGRFAERTASFGLSNYAVLNFDILHF